MPPHPLDSASQRVRRANEHLADIRKLADDLAIKQRNAFIAYFQSHPWPTDKSDSNISVSITSPMSFPIYIGELCYNLRSALDYLVFELARLDSGLAQDGTQFPIEDKRKTFEWRIKRGWLKGVNIAHIAAIERLQPYKGCNWTKTLQRLTNKDKHREFQHIRGGITLFVHSSAEFTPSDTAVAAYRTKDLVTGTEVQMYLDLQETISFDDGTPIIQTFEEIILGVAQTIDIFKPEFK